MKLVTSLLAVFVPVWGGLVDIVNEEGVAIYPQRDYPAPSGKMWTAWSNWYGCHSMDNDKFDPEDGGTPVMPPWGNDVNSAKKDFCLHSARYLAQSVRYRECALPDDVYWMGDMTYVHESETDAHQLRVRDVDFDEDTGVTPGDLKTGLQEDYLNIRPPTGDPRESLAGGAFDIGDDSNVERSYVNNVAKPSLRFACDPRVEMAAIRCLEMDLCKAYFPEGDMQTAYMRVNAKLADTNQYKVDTTDLETLVQRITESFPWQTWENAEAYDQFFNQEMEAYALTDSIEPTVPAVLAVDAVDAIEAVEATDTTEAIEAVAAIVAVEAAEAVGPWIYREVSYATLAEAMIVQQAVFDSKNDDMLEIQDLIMTQMKLVIEAEIQRGTEWKDAIPEPYLTLWYDVAICVDDCPVPLPWTSWSCHCQLGSAMNTRSGINTNPDSLPDCACDKSARFRVQICKDNNADGTCRDELEPEPNCLSCNIYPDSIENSAASTATNWAYTDKHECKNYGWNWPDIDNDYEGITMLRLFHSNFIDTSQQNVDIQNRVEAFLFRPDSMGLTAGQWPVLTTIFTELWQIEQDNHPITEGDNVGEFKMDEEVFMSMEDADAAQLLGFYALFVADHVNAANYLERHCYFNDHSRSFEYYTPFKYGYNERDEYAIQFDQCFVSSKWSAYGEWTGCSATCETGTRSRERDCMKLEMVNGEEVWSIDNSLIGQDCQCQGETVAVEPCNTQCCVHWNECMPGTDCTDDLHYVSGKNWNHEECFGCGERTMTAQRRCMCFDQTDDRFYHASWMTGEEDYPSCQVDDTVDNIDFGLAAYKSTRDIPCEGLPCCGEWTSFDDWSSCDNTCRDCVLDWIPRSKSRQRFCGCPSSHEDHDHIGIDLDYECGGIASEKQYGLCNDVANGERPDCCPEPCPNWDDWSDCELPCREMMYENFQCVDTSNEMRERERGCCQRILDNAGDMVRFDPVAVEEAFCPQTELHETDTCDQAFCCKYSEWTDWDTCKTANGEELECTNDPSVKGYKTRDRYPYCNDKTNCPDCWQIEECAIPRCPGWAMWGGWSECSCNCGKVGTQARTRTCSGMFTDDNDVETMADIGSKFCPCNGDPTLKHITTDGGLDRCNFGDSCDGTYYGVGMGEWNTNMINGFHDQQDPGYFQTRRCNTNAPPCAQWRRFDNSDPNSEMYWSKWGQCDVSCGHGEELRRRECVRVFNVGGIGSIEMVDDEECDGQPINEKFERRSCHVDFCPEIFAEQWSNWSGCSSTCQNHDDDLATRMRQRTCFDASHQNELGECLYNMHEQVECPRQPCPKWEHWEDWSPCSEECRGREGFTKRERDCSVPALHGHEGCEGDNFQYHECNENIECPMWSSWSRPTECYYIGDPDIGERDRNRFCEHGSFNGHSCPYERRIQTSPCRVCDIEITRPRIYVRRAQVTLRVSMSTNIVWSDELNDPNSEMYQNRITALQEELVANANLAEGQQLVVTGLSLCPPAGCGRKRRDGDDMGVYADVEIIADCQTNCETTTVVVENLKDVLCENNKCSITFTAVNEDNTADDAASEKKSAAQTYFMSFALCFVSLLLFIN